MFVNLGVAGDFVILSKSEITNVYKSTVTGDIEPSPITGAASPLPYRITNASRLTTAVSNMQTGASINGRMLAQTAITLQMNTVKPPQ